MTQLYSFIQSVRKEPSQRGKEKMKVKKNNKINLTSLTKRYNRSAHHSNKFTHSQFIDNIYFFIH